MISRGFGTRYALQLTPTHPQPFTRPIPAGETSSARSLLDRGQPPDATCDNDLTDRLHTFLKTARCIGRAQAGAARQSRPAYVERGGGQGPSSDRSGDVGGGDQAAGAHAEGGLLAWHGFCGCMNLYDECILLSRFLSFCAFYQTDGLVVTAFRIVVLKRRKIYTQIQESRRFTGRS